MARTSYSIAIACLAAILSAAVMPRPALADTLDLAEVKTAAGAHFDKLDKDSDGTLDAQEMQGIIGPKAFRAADPDNDGTLTKDEYLALVEKLFHEADADKDGTLSVAELRSKAAHALKHLID